MSPTPLLIRDPSLQISIGSLVVPFLRLPYRLLNMNHRKELLWSLWVGLHDDQLEGTLAHGPSPPAQARLEPRKNGDANTALSRKPIRTSSSKARGRANSCRIFLAFGAILNHSPRNFGTQQLFEGPSAQNLDYTDSQECVKNLSCENLNK